MSGPNGFLSRAAILAADDQRRERVEVPEWGGAVYLRVMTGTERDQFETEFTRSKANFRARLLAYTLADESGQRLFTEEDIGSLGAKSGAVLERLLKVAIRLNAIGKEDVAELEGNSVASHSGGSSSDSPSDSE